MRRQFALIDEREELHLLVEDIHGDYDVYVIENTAGQVSHRFLRHISQNEVCNLTADGDAVLESYIRTVGQDA